MGRRALIWVLPALGGCFSPDPLVPPDYLPTQTWIVQSLDPSRSSVGYVYTGDGPLERAFTFPAAGPVLLHASSESKEAHQLGDVVGIVDKMTAPRPLSSSAATGFVLRRHDDSGWREGSADEAPPLGLPAFDWNRCAQAGGCAGDEDNFCVIPCPGAAVEPAPPVAAALPCSSSAASPDCLRARPASCEPGERRVALACEAITEGCPLPPARFAANAPAGAIYVDATATAPGDGSRSNPYPTLADAMAVGTSTTVALAPGAYPWPNGPVGPIRLLGACEATTVSISDPISPTGDLVLEHLQLQAVDLAIHFGVGRHRLSDVTIVAPRAATFGTGADARFDRVLIVADVGLDLQPGSALDGRRIEMITATTAIRADDASIRLLGSLWSQAAGGLRQGLMIRNTRLELSESRFSGSFRPVLDMQSTSTATLTDVAIDGPIQAIEVRRSDARLARVSITEVVDFGVHATALTPEGDSCEEDLQSSTPRIRISDLTITQSETPQSPCAIGAIQICAAVDLDCGGELMLERASLDSVGAALYIGELSTARVDSIDAAQGRTGGVIINKAALGNFRRMHFRHANAPAVTVAAPQLGGGPILIEDLVVEDAQSDAVLLRGGVVQMHDFRLDRGARNGVAIGNQAAVALARGWVSGFPVGIELTTGYEVPSLAASTVAFELMRDVRLLPEADKTTTRLSVQR